MTSLPDFDKALIELEEGIVAADTELAWYGFIDLDTVRGALAEASNAQERGMKLYIALAMLDTRDGSLIAQIVQAAREGFERSHPDVNEKGAWGEFERLRSAWNRLSATERRHCLKGYGDMK